MSPRIFSSDLPLHLHQNVLVKGFFHSLRRLGKLSFLILRDQKGLFQIVIEDKEELKKVSSLHEGSILSVQGKVSPSSAASLGLELIQPSITVQVPILIPPPIEYYKPEIPSDLDFILDHRPISLRNRKIQAVFKIQGELAHAYRLFMHDQIQAVEYFGPNLIGASSEGGAEFFNVDYFGYPATLAQSSQLYKQILVGVNERAFAIMPFFRAEPSHTPRHLSEGKQLEFEIGFFDHWHEILEIQERCIKFMIEHLQKSCAPELLTLETPLVLAPPDVPFPRVSFQEAQEIFYQRTQIDERNEPDLSPAAEKALGEYAREKFGTDFIFILDWKTSKRPFYSYPKEDNPTLTNTFDLLCAGTEITSGGQRRHTYDSMIEGIQSKGMKEENFQDYLSIFKYGMPPHGGFGMGLERLTMTFLRLKNIREASLFPSDTKRIASNRMKAKIFFGEENLRNEILRLLKENSFEFRLMTHVETTTSQDSSDVRKTSLHEGVKSLILKGKTSRKNFQANIPADCKLDLKAFSALVGEKCELESASIIEERFGLLLGAIPPFGNLLNLDTYFDQSLSLLENVSFNCGLKTESIQMKGQDLISLVQPHFESFTASLK